MSSLHQPTARSVPFARSLAIAALMGATMLATPLIAAHAETAVHPRMLLAQAAAPQNPAAAAVTSPAATAPVTKAETIEARIDSLHTTLQITPAEEAHWKKVAQTMRDNAALMDRLAADKANQDTQSTTAVEDLRNYGRFAEAHVAGLKKLTASFKTLYDSMPAAQKKVADGVFKSAHQRAVQANG